MNRYPNSAEQACAWLSERLIALAWPARRLVRVMDQRYEGQYLARRLAFRWIGAVDAVSNALSWLHDRHLERQMEWEARQRKLP